MGAWGEVIPLNRERTGDIEHDTADLFVGVWMNHTDERGKFCYLTFQEFEEPVPVPLCHAKSSQALTTSYLLAEDVTADDLRDLSNACLLAAAFLEGGDE